MMMEKIKKAIIARKEEVLIITLEDIEKYLFEVKKAILDNRYRIELNYYRQDNIDLFTYYVIDTEIAKNILLELVPTDFSEVLQNEHREFKHELLYVFGKDVTLLERFSNSDRNVPLYIKFNKLDNHYVIVVSMHEQKYPIKYYFK